MKLGRRAAVVDMAIIATPTASADWVSRLQLWPVCPGSGARGKVIDFRVPLEIEGTRVAPGDLVFGDVDGVCVVPRHSEEEVLVKALEKARGEKLVKKAINRA